MDRLLQAEDGIRDHCVTGVQTCALPIFRAEFKRAVTLHLVTAFFLFGKDCLLYTSDYFHTNFYLTLGIGSYKQPYKVEPPKLGSKDKPEIFKHPEGPAHEAMRRALGKERFGFIESRKYAGEIILGEDCFGSRGEVYFWPKEYSSAKMAQKRIDKLEEAGIRCELTGYNGGYIRLLGYTPEMRDSLERERQEYAAAYQAWYSKQNLKTI